MRSDPTPQPSTPAGDRRAAPRRLLADQRGAVALMFGLMILPLFAAIGLAIDFGNIMTSRTKAQMAADAAALQASGIARDLIKNGDGSEALTAAAIAEAKQRGEALFRAHADQSGLKGYTLNLTIKREGQSLNTTAAFEVQTDTYVGRVVGTDAFMAAGAASASSSLPTFSDVYLALDISQSMGIASTQAGMNTLYQATSNMKNSSGVVTQFDKPIKCVFGCHAPEHVGQSPYHNQGLKWVESFSSIAKRNGVELRIDVLRKATKSMIDTASRDADNAPIYRLALYTMGMTTDYNSPRLIELASLSNNFTLMSSQANLINLGPAPDGRSDSYINENLVTFAGKVPTSGDGARQTNSKTYAFIVTDGLGDTRRNNNTCVQRGGRCVSTVANKEPTGRNPSCEALKKKGVTVGVLYTTYSRINPIDTVSPQQDWYKVEVEGGITDVTKIPKDLEACASPGWFFQASDAASIEAAMAKMFEQTTHAPSLTH